MITAQNIQDVRFSTSMSGYKKAEVDAFLDQCMTTIEELNTTIEENNRKMQVLAETVVEYRNQEDSIRAAVLGAQRMSESVVAEANEKAATIVAEAEEKASHIADEAKKEIQEEMNELARIQSEVAAFRARLLSTYREHLTLIGILTDEDKTAPKAAEPAEDSEKETVTELSFDAEPTSAAETLAENDIKLDISAFEFNDED